MPEAYLMLYGASIVAALFIFGVVIWTGIERHLALAALERRVRERIMRRRPAAPPLWLVDIGTPRASPPRRRQNAA